MKKSKSKNSNTTFTSDELRYIDSLQSRADSLVSDPNSPYYEEDEFKRRTAAREVMRKMEEERAERAERAITAQQRKQ